MMASATDTSEADDVKSLNRALPNKETCATTTYECRLTTHITNVQNDDVVEVFAPPCVTRPSISRILRVSRVYRSYYQKEV